MGRRAWGWEGEHGEVEGGHKEGEYGGVGNMGMGMGMRGK